MSAKSPMVVLVTPSSASHTLRVPKVRARGRPLAKPRKRIDRSRRSPYTAQELSQRWMRVDCAGFFIKMSEALFGSFAAGRFDPESWPGCRRYQRVLGPTAMTVMIAFLILIRSFRIAFYLVWNLAHGNGVAGSDAKFNIGIRLDKFLIVSSFLRPLLQNFSLFGLKERI